MNHQPPTPIAIMRETKNQVTSGQRVSIRVCPLNHPIRVKGSQRYIPAPPRFGNLSLLSLAQELQPLAAKYPLLRAEAVRSPVLSMPLAAAWLSRNAGSACW